MTELYWKQPEIVRKTERDFAVIFLSLIITSGVLYQATPNYHTLTKVVVASAGMAVWRIVRSLVEKYSSTS